MGEVVQFPDLNMRSWAEISRSIRTMLRSLGIPENGIEWIIEDMYPRYQELSGSYELSAPIAASEAISTLIGVLHAQGTKALLEILKLELTLWLAMNGEPAPDITFEVPKPPLVS